MTALTSKIKHERNELDKQVSNANNLAPSALNIRKIILNNLTDF